MPDKVGIPTVSGIKSSGEAALYGAAGGALFGLSRKFLGQGWLGAIAGVLLAGSVVKGDIGKDIAITLGVLAGNEVVGGTTDIAPAAGTSEIAGFIAI